MLPLQKHSQQAMSADGYTSTCQLICQQSVGKTAFRPVCAEPAVGSTVSTVRVHKALYDRCRSASLQMNPVLYLPCQAAKCMS